MSEIQKELAELREEFRAMKAQWDNEKNAIGFQTAKIQNFPPTTTIFPRISPQ